MFLNVALLKYIQTVYISYDQIQILVPHMSLIELCYHQQLNK